MAVMRIEIGDEHTRALLLVVIEEGKCVLKKVQMTL